jgi:hypothetical protein
MNRASPSVQPRPAAASQRQRKIQAADIAKGTRHTDYKKQGSGQLVRHLSQITYRFIIVRYHYNK